MQMKDYTERQKEFHFLLSLKFFKHIRLLYLGAFTVQFNLYETSKRPNKWFETHRKRNVLYNHELLKKKKKLDRRTNPCTILRVRINSC